MSGVDDARERQANELINQMLAADYRAVAAMSDPHQADLKRSILIRDDARASLMRLLAGVPPAPPQAPAQADAAPGEVGVVRADAGAPLPCPFCGVVPEALRNSPNGAVICRTPNCVMRDNPETLSAWNTRAPVAAPPHEAPRHPGADVARLCIVNARRLIEDNTAEGIDLERLLSAGRYLRQALDALRPLPAPLSAMYWLSHDGDDA